MTLMRRVIRLENRVKALETARTAPSARLDDDIRTWLYSILSKPMKASKIEELVKAQGFGIGRFRRVRAKLSEEGKIELYRAPHHWVWRRVAK